MHFTTFSIIPIHSLRAGWDDYRSDDGRHRENFNPPTLCGWDLPTPEASTTGLHFNPPTPCGVGHNVARHFVVVIPISIHPPRAGWAQSLDTSAKRTRFQSTHPVRGGTDFATNLKRICTISIHPPRAGWDQSRVQLQFKRLISIHPPRAGWDFIPIRRGMPCALFQSTHPVRGGTAGHPVYVVEGEFQSTHPVRGGTSTSALYRFRIDISIHPPRAGWDPNPLTGCIPG